MGITMKEKCFPLLHGIQCRDGMLSRVSSSFFASPVPVTGAQQHPPHGHNRQGEGAFSHVWHRLRRPPTRASGSRGLPAAAAERGGPRNRKDYEVTAVVVVEELNIGYLPEEV